jgi:hypothetical protein
MGKEKDKLDFSKKFEVVLPTAEQTMPVAISYWQTLMSRIKNCGDSSHTYESLAWACVGICGSALIAAASLPFSIDFIKGVPPDSTHANLAGLITEIAFLALALGSAVLAFFGFRFARQHAKDRADIRSIIVEDMQAHADKHPFGLVQPEMPDQPIAKTSA